MIQQVYLGEEDLEQLSLSGALSSWFAPYLRSQVPLDSLELVHCPSQCP